MALTALLEAPGTVHAPGGSQATEQFAAVAERLRRSTVGVRGPREQGGGSGVIWSADGLIVTNAHVARGSHALVDLWDGRTVEATVADRDPDRDLAVLKVDAGGLPAVQPADSDRLRVGQLVIAVGNPLGVTRAVTAGIIHTVGLTGDRGRKQSWVQADVRLAPGNSGGLLADAHGGVIGINSMINGGLALAVPSNDVVRFLRRGERPYLGVTMQSVATLLAGTRVPGLLVVAVTPGSPAETGGLLIGDVLIGIGGRMLEPSFDLSSVLYDAGIGATLHLDIVRGGKRTNRGIILVRKEEAGTTAHREAPHVEAA